VINEIFNPQSVVIIGASEKTDKWGYQILNNLINGGYKGKIFPINPKSSKILGYNCHKSILEIHCSIDLAVIVIPAKFVFDTMIECSMKGIKAVVIISAGFSELGNVEEEKLIMSVAKRNNISVIGPNTFGVISKSSNMNVSLIGE